MKAGIRGHDSNSSICVKYNSQSSYAQELNRLAETGHSIYTVTAGDRFASHGLVGAFIIDTEVRTVAKAVECADAYPSDILWGRSTPSKFLLPSKYEEKSDLHIVQLDDSGFPVLGRYASCQRKTCISAAPSKELGTTKCAFVPTFVLSCRVFTHTSHAC